jgi:lipoprotein-releasing system permease protein
MFHPLPLWIGFRYLRAKRRNGFISFISLASIVGIALGVAALIIVISVMNGFERELRARILSMVSHATIADARGHLDGWEDAIKVTEKHPEVVAAAPYVEREVLVRAGQRSSGALIRAVDPERESSVNEVAQKIKVGALSNLEPGRFGIVLGVELAWKLGVDVGDDITVYAPEFTASPVGALPRMKNFTVVGLLEVGMFEYDSALALIHLSDGQRLFRMQESVTGVRLKLKDLMRAYRTGTELSSELGGGLIVRDWIRQHANLFRAIATEKVVMFLILSLIVAVAAFNLVSSLVMLVTDKQADIAILRTLGATPNTIRNIFIVQGLSNGCLGVLIGAVVGVLVALNLGSLVQWLERTLGFETLPSDVYYINTLPSELRWMDVSAVVGVGLVFCLLATLYPSWRASRVQPAEALRYE